jgi:regulation of enolase protein 1 (concanavalin A-like superfamily)
VWVDTWFPNGGAGSQLKTAEEGKSTHLRLTRKEKAITVSYSFDGKEWSAPLAPRQGLDFPEEVTVGVFFAHSTHQTLEATFDGLTVGKPKGKK